MGEVRQRTYRYCVVCAEKATASCRAAAHATESRAHAVWWIRYYRNGRRHEESSHSRKKGAALTLLRQREGKIADGVPVSAQAGRLTFDTAVAAVVADYKANGKKSVDELEQRIAKHLTAVFGGRRMNDITTPDIRAYAATRLKAGAANATANRELSIIRRAFSLAVKDGVLMAKPYVPMLKESNVRKGFMDDAEVATISAALPDYVRPIVRFAYVSGWRVQSEILTREWRHVDLKAGEIRLDAGETKNGQPRVFLFTTELATLFADLWKEHEALKKAGTVCPFVFQRSGERIKSVRTAWENACTAVGLPGRLLHDLRRSAVRNMERSGLSRSVAMQLTGHLTESVYRRYAITSQADLQEGVRKLNAVRALSAAG